MPKTVLCRLPNHVGDCVMTLPALRLLADSGLKPSLVGKRFAEDLMLGMGWRFDPIEGHISEDYERIRSLSADFGESPLGLLLPNSFGSALLFRIGRIRSAGFATDLRGFLLDRSIPEPGTCHEVQRFFAAALGALRAWGIEPARTEPEPRLGLSLLARHRAGARNILKTNGIQDRFVLLAPIARGLHHGQKKCWAHFDELAQFITSLGFIPLVLPSPHEVDITRESCPSARILPSTTLGCYAGLCELASLVIANDSGISHVAAGVGARQVTLIGVTDPKRTGPWNPNATVLGSEGHWPEKDEVFSTVEALLKDSSRS